MKFKIYGVLIGIIEFAIMIGVIFYYFKRVFVPISSVILIITLFQSLIYNKLFNIKINKKVITVIILNVMLGLAFYVSLPKYSFNQAKDIVTTKYKLDQNSFDILNNSNETTVPIVNKNIFDIKTTSRFYYFTIHNNDNKQIYIMVNPQSGEIIEIDKY